MSSVLVATLGAEPQVISLTTQYLLHGGEPLRRVALLHTARDHPPIAQSLPPLESLFDAQPGWPPLERTELPIADVLTPAQIQTFTDALFLMLKRLAREGYRLHLLLAGGRKPMAIMGASVAQMLLGPEDSVWYLHSAEALRISGQMLYTDAASVQLVRVPLPRLNAPSPRYTVGFAADSPAKALAALEDAQVRRLHYFVWQELTAAERQVAQVAATEVLTVAQLARRLHKSQKTIANQLNAIYSKMEASLGLQPDRSVKREFLRRELAAFFAGPPSE